MSEEIYYEPRRLSAEESLSALIDRNETPEMGCIGHLCGDFGGGGKAFHSRWSDHLCADRNDELFKAVFGKLIDTLRERTICFPAARQRFTTTVSRIRNGEKSERISRRFWKFRHWTSGIMPSISVAPNLG